MPTIELADIRVHFQRKGSGERLLFFPDSILTSSAYQNEIDHFSKRFEVITFDYPGTGKSTHERKYPDEQLVDYWGFWADLACHLLMALEIKRCFVIGVAGGALTALHFAGKQAQLHQIRTQGLILDSFLANWDTRTLHRWLDVREHFYVRNQENLLRQHGEDWRQVVDADTIFLRQLADHGGYVIPVSILNNVPCPTFLTGHQEDPVLPGLAEEYAHLSALIPDCSLYLSSKSNHPYIERPFMWSDTRTFRRLTDGFFSKVKDKPE